MAKIDAGTEDYFVVQVKKNDTRVSYDSRSKTYSFTVKSNYSLDEQAAEDLQECLTEARKRVNDKESE